MAKLFGRIYDLDRTLAYANTLKYPNAKNIPRLMVQADRQPTYIWKHLLQIMPSWIRGQQAIGDCVSWGAELAATCLLAWLAAQGKMKWQAPADPTCIYGGCRVEVAGGEMGNGDGAMGAWAAEWLHNWGVLLAKDYSKETGNPEHDLSSYSGRRAKAYGYYGCGGENDNGALDKIAKLHPVKEVTLVTDMDHLIEVLLRGCPVTCASGVGYEGSRNNDGIIPARGSWPHQMCWIGIDFSPSGEPYPICANSWGDSPVHGPFPGITDEAIKLCAWRCRPQDAERQLREQDCFAFSSVDWEEIQPFNFTENLIV